MMVWERGSVQILCGFEIGYNGRRAEMKRVQASVFQFNVKRGDIAHNVKLVRERLEKCPEGIVVLPEMWSCGFDYKRLPEHAMKTPEILEELAPVAQKKRLIISGSLPELKDGKVFNTAYLMDSGGKIAGLYRKVHLFFAGGEGRGFAPGESTAVFDTEIGPIGMMICYDLRFPELARTLAVKGAKIITIPAQWPRPRISHWRTLSRARAVENQLFTIACNRCGVDGKIDYAGASIIVSPMNEILAEAGEEEGLRTGIMDFDILDDYRKNIPCLEERQPEVYFK